MLPLATLDDLLFNRPDVGFGIGEMTLTGMDERRKAVEEALSQWRLEP